MGDDSDDASPQRAMFHRSLAGVLTPTVIGVIVGGIVLVLVLTAALLIWYRRRSQWAKVQAEVRAMAHELSSMKTAYTTVGAEKSGAITPRQTPRVSSKSW